MRPAFTVRAISVNILAMNRITLLNIAFNLLLTIAFVMLDMRALAAGLEETFVSLALFYGLISLIGNALFVAAAKRGTSS